MDLYIGEIAMKNRITSLFNIQYPIIQGGMIWCSGWELASAVSNAGGLGLIGSGSMYPEVLRAHIQKCKSATAKPFGVNVPLLYPDIDKHLEIIVEEGVKIVFTSAGNPAKYTSWLKERGITVVHVVANTKFAKKCEEAGVDAIVAEGSEAGGHNGREETTTMCLIPMITDSTSLPAASEESSSHISFKDKIIQAKEGSTQLTLKEITPVRLLKNAFFEQVEGVYEQGGSVEQLKELLGRGRAKKGMFEGDLEEGELEIGQISARLDHIEKAGDIVNAMMLEFGQVTKGFQGVYF